MGYKLAIDFGMTNSVIAEWDESSASGRTLDVNPLSLRTSTGAFLIPTLLYVRDGRTGEIMMGQAVRDQGLDHQRDNRLFRNFKRVPKTEAIFNARIIDGAPWTEAQAGQAFLRRLLDSIPYPASDIDQLVISVPVAALEEYTSWLGRMFVSIPPEKVRIVDESTAAALGYAVTEPGALVLVIDFGGGTLDLSLVRLPEVEQNAVHGNAQVIAKAGISLGGSDIDQWLLQEVLRRENLSPGSPGPGYSALLAACEQAKIALSTEHITTLQLLSIGERPISVSITRAELESLLSQNGLFLALQRALEKVMGLAAQKGVYREDIQHVLLVGGTTLIPSIQQTLDQYFRAITQRQRKAITQMPAWPAMTWNIDNTSIRADKPFTAVVEGALRVATGLHLDDQLAHGYGLRYLPPSGVHQFDEIIPMGSSYPSKRPVAVTLGASRPEQQFVEFVIAQINTDAVSSAQADEGHIFLINAGRPLQVKLSPPGRPGEARLRAEFSVDALRRLRVSVLDLKSGRHMLVDAIVTALGSSTDPSAQSLDSKGPTGNEPVLAQLKRNKLRSFLQSFGSFFKYAAPKLVSVEAYLADLRSEDALKRFDAADALARRGDREARLAFTDILKTGTPHQRASAARHLFRFSWFVAEPLFREALIDEDARVQEAAMFALCKMRLPDSYNLAAEVLQNSSDAMRSSAVWAMYSHPDPATVPILALALQAQDSEIRALALEALGATEAPDAIPVVKSAMKDGNPEIQYAATLSWVELARETSYSELAGWIQETRGWSRYWILRGFFHATNYMGMETGRSPDVLLLIQALKNALKDDLPEARLAAILPLAWMRHPDAETTLLAGFMNETDSETRAHMLTAAVHLMSPAANALLAEARQSQDQLVRQTAQFLQRNY